MPGSSSPGSASHSTTDVLIAGGGPCGLMLANELGRRGIRCLLIDAKPGTLCRQAKGLPSVDLRFGWTLERFDDDGREVSATVRPTRDGPAQEVRARCLVGADRCSTVFIASGRSTAAFEAGARELGMDLRVVPTPQASLRELYEAPLALIRPDQIVAWRGATADDASAVLARVTGRTVR